MLKKLMHSTRWRFILCVIITNLLSISVTMFVWLPLSRNLFPVGNMLVPYIPMGIATLVAIPISSAISLHSAKPIQDMVEATKSISRGDFSVRVSEEWEGAMGELLHSFNQMTAELGSTELMRNDFINIFSHEFKTPIVSIRGFARRLRSGNLTQEHLRHIFDKFYQADTAHASAGNGLGLALVRRIIELSKGEIFVESQENHGTVFIVRLPLQQC